MKEIVLAKYGEIALKGLNKKSFEDMLTKNIKRRLKSLGKFELTSAQSTTYITPLDEDIDLQDVVDRVSKIFGIAALCRACVLFRSARRTSLTSPKRALSTFPTS